MFGLFLYLRHVFYTFKLEYNHYFLKNKITVFMKKRLLFFLLLITISSLGYTQQISTEVTYVEEKEIIYRVGNDLDDYMRERCKLDVYYPENKNGFGLRVAYFRNTQY